MPARNSSRHSFYPFHQPNKFAAFIALHQAAQAFKFLFGRSLGLKIGDRYFNVHFV